MAEANLHKLTLQLSERSHCLGASMLVPVMLLGLETQHLWQSHVQHAVYSQLANADVLVICRHRT